METIKKYDHIWVGLILGITGPFIGFWLYYLLQFSELKFTTFIHFVVTHQNLQAPILGMSLLLNAFLFFGMLKLNMEKVSRGILISMFIYVPLMLFLKFR